MSTLNIFDVCNKLQWCRNEDCQQTHQRKYIGICLDYINQQSNEIDIFNKKCYNPNCQQYHFDLMTLNILLQIPPINGIRSFNLCSKKNCQDEQCKFVHKKWSEGVCLNQYLSICKNQKCQNRHIDWQDLRKEVYQQYNITEINPENICEKNDCRCNFHLETYQNLCIKYLKGECPNLKCNKKHCEWEDINQIHCKSQELLPCTKKLQNNSFIEFVQQAQRNEIQQVCDREKLIKFQREIHQANIIDVIFILDLTLSMKQWLDTIKIQIANLIYQFKETINGYGVRVGFVGYRDTSEGDEKLVYRCLTENFEEITKVISKQVAKGGGDQAEDVVAGLEQGLNLNISKHPDSILCTFLITDAPCHGKQYHDDNVSDDQNDQIKPGTLENVIQKYKQAKKLSFFTCFKIRDSTNKMFSIMQEVFPEIMITRKSQPNDFPELVTFALESSIQKSLNLTHYKLKSSSFYTGAKFVKTKFINYQFSDNQTKKQLFWQQFYKYVDQFQRKGVTALEINLEPIVTSFNKSNQSNEIQGNTYVFRIFDALNNRYMVTKLSKEHVNKYKQNQINENDVKIAEEQARTRYYTAAYANQLAYLFRKKTIQFNEIPPIFYVSPMLYTLESPFYGVKLLYAETCIDSAKFLWNKYSSNSALTQQQYYFYSAFSHFTYNETGGTLVLLDLQGSENIFTDASIQSQDNMIPILEGDPTNLKNLGITIFLQKQHEKCSIVCQKLALSRKDFQIENPLINYSQWRLQDHQMISVLCETCQQFRSYQLDLYRQMKEIKCDNCRELEIKPIEAQCRCCSQFYHHDPNEDLLSLTIYGYCKNCKSKCLLKENKCQYCKCFCQFKLKQIGRSNIYVCKSGYQYLQALNCQICQSKYKFEQILSEIDYQEGKYICCQKQ